MEENSRLDHRGCYGEDRTKEHTWTTGGVALSYLKVSSTKICPSKWGKLRLGGKG
jgi:hypothetical protein